MTKKTPWFDYETKPVRKGVYEVQSLRIGTYGYAYWNGEKWGWAETSILFAESHPDFNTADQDKVWRGLLKESV